jgi:8-oxo-dGTP diphosphatase
MIACNTPDIFLKYHFIVKEFLKEGAKLENSLTPLVPPLLPPLLVVAVALVRPDGRILMQQRPSASMHGDLWEFPGGKVEPGETPEHAAARELHEELGVDLAPDSLLSVGFASSGSLAPLEGPPGRAVVILLYICREWRGEPQAHEAQALSWCSLEAIPDLAMPPLDYPLAANLSTFLLGNAI